MQDFVFIAMSNDAEILALLVFFGVLIFVLTRIGKFLGYVLNGFKPVDNSPTRTSGSSYRSQSSGYDPRAGEEARRQALNEAYTRQDRESRGEHI